MTSLQCKVFHIDTDSVETYKLHLSRILTWDTARMACPYYSRLRSNRKPNYRGRDK